MKQGIMVLFLIFLGGANVYACEHSATTFECVEFLRNYDGDTITVRIPDVHPLLGENITVRINGIDAPEMATGDACEKRQALNAKKRVHQILSKAQRVTLSQVQRDKYFRILADVYADDINVGEDLLAQNLAVPYDGGHKEKVNWCWLY